MYDYAIIGAGVAGLKLALELCSDDLFCTKKILILEKSTLEINDKRWCFWEKGKGKYDSIVHHQWNEGKFIKKNNSEIKFNLNSYHYKMVLGLDFYNYAKEILLKNSNVTWVTEEVTDAFIRNEISEDVFIQTTHKEYLTKICFDSRIDNSFFIDQKYIKILQHFKGFHIQFEENIWDENQFVMMDFSASYQNQTSFMYVLPVKSNEALIEFTLFTSKVLQNKEYIDYIKKYIKEKISTSKYSIIEEENGIIPMTNFPFHKQNTNQIIKIGTAGGWVRPSTGYSFKKTDFYVTQILKNIKTNQKIDYKLFNQKYYFMDTILLNILKNENQKGPEIFAQMYQNNSMKLIFKFLDGNTNIIEDLKVITSFNPLPFIRAVFREIYNRLKNSY